MGVHGEGLIRNDGFANICRSESVRFCIRLFVGRLTGILVLSRVIGLGSGVLCGAPSAGKDQRCAEKCQSKHSAMHSAKVSCHRDLTIEKTLGPPGPASQCEPSIGLMNIGSHALFVCVIDIGESLNVCLWSGLCAKFFIAPMWNVGPHGPAVPSYQSPGSGPLKANSLRRSHLGNDHRSET